MKIDRRVHDMIDLATDDSVGLVMRWDGDERLAWTFWSLAAGSALTRDHSPVYIQPFVRRNRTFHQGGGHVDLDMGLSFASGLHAEEVMLLSWENLLRVVRQERGEPAYYPKRVDIVLSKSPCHGPAGSPPLLVRYSEGPIDFPFTGCASKLKLFFETQPVERWSLLYFELAGFRSDHDDEVRLNAGRYVHGKLEEVEETIRRKTPEWRQKVSRAPVDLQPGLVQQQVDSFRQRQQVQLGKTQLFQENRNRMRVQSVAQAQHGLVLLQGLPHVDVRRILRRAVVGLHRPEQPFGF